MLFWSGIAVGAVAIFVLIVAMWRLLRTPSPESSVKNQLIIKFLEDTPTERIEEIHKKAKCTVIDENKELGFQVLQSKKKVQRMLKSYKKLKEVDYVEPNYIYKASYFPNDTYFSYQYGPQKIQTPSAWDVTQSNKTIKIAIIDTGVQLNHPDLASKLLPGYDFVNQDNMPNDGNGHGTHVAGLAAAVTNDGRGIAGVYLAGSGTR